LSGLDTCIDGKVQRIQAVLYAEAKQEPAVRFERLYKYVTRREWIERQAFPKGIGSVKNIAYRLLEALRNLELREAELASILHSRRQIRFDTS
jgi:hypothetical protein